MTKTSALLLAAAVTLALGACGKAAAPGAVDAPAAASAAPAAAPGVPEAAAVTPVSGVYTLDPDHTGVLAQWSHFGLSRPSAHFRIGSGTLTWNADDVTRSTVDVTLPIASVDTFVPALDEHLKKADFFDAAQFPTATFRSTSVQTAGTNALTVTGDLTIKGKTRPVTLEVTLNGAGKHAMSGLESIGFSATGTIKRSDFGVDAFVPNISDEVALRITGEGSIAEAPTGEAKAE